MQINPKQSVILIGVGRYGNGLVGQKYKEGKIEGRVCAVVDPNISKISKQKGYNFERTPQFETFEQINPEFIREETAVEIATIPKIIPEIFDSIVKKGIKKVILPKPVAPNLKDYEKMMYSAQKNEIKTAITSNWHYSEITKLTKEIIEKIQGKTKKKYKCSPEIKSIPKGMEIEKVELEYSKKNEKLNIDPPSQELPHALQIIYSTGLTNFKDTKPILDPLKQTKSRVNIRYENTSNIKKGIEINSDLKKDDIKEGKRERTLKIYLNDDDGEPDIISDYNVDFQDGICIKPGSVTVDIEHNGKKTKWHKEITEDNLEAMYKPIFNYFKTGTPDNTLTMEKYLPIMEQIHLAQTKWNNIVNQQSSLQQ